jgi:hypothetical protein
MLVSFWPLLLFTHSLLMKSPVGCTYFRPFGAVSSMERSDIFFVVLLNVRIEKLILEAGGSEILECSGRVDSLSDEYSLECVT